MTFINRYPYKTYLLLTCCNYAVILFKMSLFATLLLGCMISYSSASDLFTQEDSLAPYYEDNDSDSTGNEEYDSGQEPYKVNSATVTYDKSEYLGDMMKEYFSTVNTPPPTFPSKNLFDQTTPTKAPKGRNNVGGFGKIDISIQYGCCASSKNEHNERPPEPSTPGTMTSTPSSGARFRVPPPSRMSFPGYGSYEATSAYPQPMYGPADFRPSEYMSHITSEMGKRNFEEQQNEKTNKIEINKQENKRHYIHSNNQHQSKPQQSKQQQQQLQQQQLQQQLQQLQQQQQLQLQQQQQQQRIKEIPSHKSFNSYRRQTENTNYQPLSYNSVSTPYPSSSEASRRPSYSSTTPFPSTSNLYTETSNYNRYNYNYEPTTIAVTTPKPTTAMTTRTTSKMNYYGAKSPVILTQEQFYSIPHPPESFFPSTLSPIPLPIPAERSSFYTSERLLSPMNLYGGYMPPGISLPVQRRYYQEYGVEKPKAESTKAPEPSGVMYYSNHVTPRSVLDDVSKIVIRGVPKSDIYEVPNPNNVHPSYDPQYEQQHHPQPHPPPNQPEQYHEQEPYDQEDESYPISTTPTSFNQKHSRNTRGNQAAITKNRGTFLKMQQDAFKLFTDAALQDFRELLRKSVTEKNIEVLEEEKQLLDNGDPGKEIGLSILDYLTVYERYSDTLNNTELATHILQDMDRAKEYLNMKLNKFWLELDVMENPAEYLEKKNYYKIREKPTGIMNIFYDWYENLSCSPQKIDQNQIKNDLVNIMKKERRYWLLLL